MSTNKAKKKLMCQECESSFCRPFELLQHMLIHAKTGCKDSFNIKVNGDNNHVCNQCGTIFSTVTGLYEHILLHSDIKAFTCGEPNCNKSYMSKSKLDQHIQKVHIQKLHVQDASEFVVIHRCPECYKQFSSRQNLKRHIKVKHHSGRETYTCDVCNADFKKKHLLTSHMYQHTFVKGFSCDFCPNEFISLREKKKHQSYHKTYNCDICEMVFSKWSQYQKHKQNEHHVDEYTCNECGRKFKKREHIVRHVKIHMAQPVFKCWYKGCNRNYTRNSNLTHHIRIKHLKLTHPCEICGVKICTKSKLLAHILVMHKNERVPKKQPTLSEGRKVRKDKGLPRASIAMKIAGLMDTRNVTVKDSNTVEKNNYGIKLVKIEGNADLEFVDFKESREKSKFKALMHINEPTLSEEPKGKEERVSTTLKIAELMETEYEIVKHDTQADSMIIEEKVIGSESLKVETNYTDLEIVDNNEIEKLKLRELMHTNEKEKLALEGRKRKEEIVSTTSKIAGLMETGNDIVKHDPYHKDKIFEEKVIDTESVKIETNGTNLSDNNEIESHEKVNQNDYSEQDLSKTKPKFIETLIY